MWLLVLAFVAISYGQVVDRPDQVIVAPLFGDDIQPLGLEANAIDAFSNLTGYPITMFKSRTSQVRSGRAPPTNAWWMDMVLHNLTTAVVSQYPLMVRAAWHTCSLEVSKMAPVVNASDPSHTYEVFKIGVQVSFRDTVGCFPHVADHDRFGVNLTVNDNTRTERDALGSILLARGHPYSTVVANNRLMSVFISAGVAKLSRIDIPDGGSLPFVGEYIDLTDKAGDRWLISLPSVLTIEVFSDGRVTIQENVNGAIRVSHVPVEVRNHQSTAGNLAHEYFDTLQSRASCIVIGGAVSHNHTVPDPLNPELQPDQKIETIFTWRTEPPTCNPIMMSLPHHRIADLSNVFLTYNLKYDSLLGELQAAVGRQWIFNVPAIAPNTTALTRERRQLCTQVQQFNALLDDMARLGNATILTGDDFKYEYGLQVYHISLMLETASNLAASSQYSNLITYARTWVNELLNGVLFYESNWGTVCTTYSTGGTHETCWGIGHGEHYSEILMGLARMWPKLLANEAETSRVRLANNLARLARFLIRDIANLSEEDEFFPVARNFDFYTFLGWGDTGVQPGTQLLGRRTSPPGTDMMGYAAVAILGGQNFVQEPLMIITGQLLLSWQSFGVDTYWYQATKYKADASAGVVGSGFTATETKFSLNFTTIAPFDRAFSSHFDREVARYVAREDSWLAEVEWPNQQDLILKPTDTPFDIMLLSLINPMEALEVHKKLVIAEDLTYRFNGLDTRVGDLEELQSLSPNAVCAADYRLPIRILGSTIWYNDSFNYFFKVMDYQPTLIGNKVSTSNIYDMTQYSTILRRDLRNIKAMGFNTVKISTDFFTVEPFLMECKQLDINVIVAQVLPGGGFRTEKFLAEEDFTQMLEYLSPHDNIVMWSIDSTALRNIDRNAYDYYVLLRKLRLLRDHLDPFRRPIIIPLTEFTAPQLAVDKTLYDLAVEAAILTTLEVNVERLTETITYLNHPIILNYESDSWNHVQEVEDEPAHASYLRVQITRALPLHPRQLLSGVTITEWVDQYWRGEASDPDFDCPDPSRLRHSVCGVRVAEFYDGMLTSEYMGINAQYQTWFKHCLRHKDAYFTLAEIFNGQLLADDQLVSCVFVSLPESMWIFLGVGTAVVAVACILLTIFVCCQDEIQAEEFFDVLQDEKDRPRWVQADTDEIYEIITTGTATVLDQAPFEGMNVSRDLEEDEFSDDDDVEVDSWEFSRWQVVIIQLDHLQRLIFDEMLCQIKSGDYEDVGEHLKGFATAVDSLHARYMNSYMGWYDAQEKAGAELGDCEHVRWELQFGSEEDPIFPPMSADMNEEVERVWNESANVDEDEMIVIPFTHKFREYELVIDPLESPTRDVAQVLDSHRVEGEDAPIGSAYRRVRRGLGESTNDKVIDLLVVLSLWHLGEQMTWFNGHWLAWVFHYVQRHMKFPPTTVLNDPRHFERRTVTMDDITESCVMTKYFDITGTKGVDEGANVLKFDDDSYNMVEIERYPFRKTFREPRRWGIIFSVIHNVYFIVHTQIISFIFWAFVTNVSRGSAKLVDQGISAMFDRIELVFFHRPDEFAWVLTTTAKVDFWLVLIGEILDVWMQGGYYHWTPEDWAPTHGRISRRDYFKLRWSAYTSVIAFMCLMRNTLFGDINAAPLEIILIYVLIRIFGIVVNNMILIAYPLKLRGAPRNGQKFTQKGVISQFLGSVLFWALTYASVQIFQAWVMFRTEVINWSFCDCDDDYSGITQRGVTEFTHDFLARKFQCANEEPRCFVAVLLIWISSLAMFIVVVNAGFLVWTVLFGSFSHFSNQWTSRKSRSMVGKKIQTAYILRTLNVKLLGFTDPRDTSVARKVWNKVIREMWDEWLLSAFEYENLLIHVHVSEVQFQLKNVFAMERLSNFLEYIQSVENEELGPCSTYPSVTIVIPVYGEDIMCPAAGKDGAFNEKIRSHQQEKTQLRFLIECYHDEWVNFVEHCVLFEGFFEDILTDEQISQIFKDLKDMKEETDEKKRRDMRGDKLLRYTAADLISDKIHTLPHLFSDYETVSIQWWASLHMQTVARTVRGMEKKREAFQFLLQLEQEYTRTEKTRLDKMMFLTDDKFQILLCLQNLANNKWYSKNKDGLMYLWDKYPKVEVTFVVDTLNYRNSPDVVRKVHDHVSGLWDCTKYLSCLACWVPADDSETEDDDRLVHGDWFVSSAYARRNPLRLEKKAKFGLNGLMQGKACNQAHSLMFAKNQLIQAIDANQDGYFDEALKLRSVLGKFFPTSDRKWSRYKIVGFPEYSITVRSGIIGRIAGYSEYIFVNLFQKVLARPLRVRMHYGHPDFFDFSWCATQGGMSKSNPLINLNEDIFAGFHVTGSGESVEHVDCMRDGKGRETNFDGANGFQMKLAFGASMQYRTRDQFELMRTSDILRRHSIFYGSVGPYIYLITIVILIYTTLFINIALTYSYKTDYALASRGSPYGAEWMVQMSLIETVPLFLQLTLDYGFTGVIAFIWDVLPATLYFLFVIMTRFSYFMQSSLNGSAAYIATGRTDPLFRRSFRHMFRYYGSTHFMPGMLLFMIVWLYMDIETKTPEASLWRTFWHWGVGISLIVTPCVFNPAISLEGLWADLKQYYLWVFGDKIERLKKQVDVLTKNKVQSKKDKQWEKAYEQLVRKHHKGPGGDTDDGHSRKFHYETEYTGDGDSDTLEGQCKLQFGGQFGNQFGGAEGESDTYSDEMDAVVLPRTFFGGGGFSGVPDGSGGHDDWDEDDEDLEPVNFGTLPNRYQEHGMPRMDDSSSEEIEMMMPTNLPPPPSGGPPLGMQMIEMDDSLGSPEHLSMGLPPPPVAGDDDIPIDVIDMPMQQLSLNSGGDQSDSLASEMPLLPPAGPPSHSPPGSVAPPPVWPLDTSSTLGDPTMPMTGNFGDSGLHGFGSDAHSSGPKGDMSRAKSNARTKGVRTHNASMGAESETSGAGSMQMLEGIRREQSEHVLSVAGSGKQKRGQNKHTAHGLMRNSTYASTPIEDSTESSGSLFGESRREDASASHDRPSNVPVLTIDRLNNARGTAAGYRTARGDRLGPSSMDGGKTLLTQRLKADTATVAETEKTKELEEMDLDYDWLCKIEKQKAELEKFLKVFKSLNGTPIVGAILPDRSPAKTIDWKTMQKGFIMLGKVVEDRDCQELLLGLGLREIDFVQFVVCYHKADGEEAGHADYGIGRAVVDINRARHRELRHIQHQLTKGRRGYLSKKDEAEKMAALTVLHNTRREFKVEFQDSTEDKSIVKSNSLKHHWKVSIILGFRGCSTPTGFLFSCCMTGLWLFAYFSLWQDITWEVFYMVLAMTWDYFLTISNIGPVTLVARGGIAVFIIFRLIQMIRVDNIFYPTIVMTYALLHVAIDLQFSFWAAFGPYILRRKKWILEEGSRELDSQRERCLVLLLRDSNERYMWGFPYYLLARQLLAVMIGLMQFIFGIIMLIFRSIKEGFRFLGELLDGQQYKKNPTDSTYVADKSNMIQEDECLGRIVADAGTNTDPILFSNKMCQVTDPNVNGNRVNMMNVIESPSKGVGASVTELPLPPPPPPPPADLLSPTLLAPPATSRKGSFTDATRSFSGLQLSARLSKTPSGLTSSWNKSRQQMEPGSNPIHGWHNPQHGPPPKAKAGDISRFNTGAYGPMVLESSSSSLTPEEMELDPRNEFDDLQTEDVYFTDGDGKVINFVKSEKFNSVAEFRSCIKSFYMFQGPSEQVQLSLLNHPISDGDDWPFRTSRNCAVYVKVHSMYAPRQRKTKVTQSKSELRTMTTLEARLAAEL